MSTTTETTVETGTDEIEFEGVRYNIAELLALKAEMAAQLGPKVLSPDAQREAAHAAVVGMKLTPAQVAVLQTHYVTVGWKFLGRAMLGKSLAECSGAR